MHEMYKAFRADDGDQLYADFSTYCRKVSLERQFDKDGETPLLKAARDGDVEALRGCVEVIDSATIAASREKLRDMSHGLRIACKYGRKECVGELLGGGGQESISLSLVYQSDDRSGWLPLHYAAGSNAGGRRAMQERPAIVSMLLAHDHTRNTINVGAVDDGSTALALAAMQGHERVAQVLLSPWHGTKIGEYTPRVVCDSVAQCVE